MSVYDNIAFGPRTHGIKKKAELDVIVRQALEDAALGVAESHRHGRGDCGYCDFQVEMIQSYPRSGNFTKGF